jgi:outer membrane biosynthesis protein TonB
MKLSAVIILALLAGAEARAADLVIPSTPEEPPRLSKNADGSFNLEPRSGPESTAAQPVPSFQEEAPSKSSSPEMNRYKAEVYRAVGARWYTKVSQLLQVLPVGRVHLQFTIHQDGIVDLKVLEGKEARLNALLALSMDSIQEAAPFPPFSASMVRLVGTSYTDDYTFIIYPRK